jgi:L-ascorbate metabolism protein UlaG (beta-lactamase superfamily)
MKASVLRFVAVLAMLSSPAASTTPAAGDAAADVADPADPRFAHAPMHDGRYSNLGPFRLPTFADLADWYWHWWRAGGTQPPPGGYDAVPVRRPDLAYLNANRRDTTVTWIGHASVLLQLAGVNVLTDPMFSKRAFFVGFLGPERKVRVPFTIPEGPHIDIVLISHNHYDHLDAPSIDALARQSGGPPLFIVPKGVDTWMKERGITDVVGLDWWDQHALPASPAAGSDHLRITMVPAAHWSARSPFDRFETLWGGYVIERVRPDEGIDYRLYFAGDTGYAPLFRDLIHARFDHFDFAAIPIGAYEPNQYLHAQHVKPSEAVRIHRELAVKQSLGVHWGTFVLTAEPFDQPPKDLASALAEAHLPPDSFVVFEHGETRVLQRFER